MHSQLLHSLYCLTCGSQENLPLLPNYHLLYKCKKKTISYWWCGCTNLPLMKRETFLQIVFGLEKKTWWEMIFNNSLFMSWWVYFFPIVPPKWATMLLSFVPSSIISSVKISMLSFPCKVIPCLARHRKHVIIWSKYFLSFSHVVGHPTYVSALLNNSIMRSCTFMAMGLLMFHETLWCFFSRTKSVGSVYILPSPFNVQFYFLSLKTPHRIYDRKWL